MTIPENYIPLLPEVEAFISQEVLHSYIDGEPTPTADGETFMTYDPSTGEALATVGRGKAADVDRAVQAARRGLKAWWHQMTPSDRSKCLWRFADLIEKHNDILAQLDALDTGKPYTTTRTSDVPLSAEHFYYYAGWPTKMEGSTIPVNEMNTLNYTLREPVGVVGLIVPWNYPLLMAAWKLAPALAAGNCIILKPAEQTPLSALYLAELATEAGFPAGVFNVVPGYGEEAGAALVEHSGVDKIGFTGSASVARQIVRASTGNLKRVSLELGGKSPNIVFADADISKAITGSTWAIFGNNGQSCTAGSRLYIQQSVYEEVLEGMAAETRGIRVGPGMGQQQPNLGPVVSEEQLARVMGYVREGLTNGGQAVVGGEQIERPGYFIQPTILTGVGEQSRVMREEIFGPVVCAVPFENIDDVIDRANDTEFGLAAGAWTTDVRKAHRLASELQAGTVWINTWGNTEAASPFGGYKQSGYGREMGKEAIDLYTEIKSVWVDLS